MRDYFQIHIQHTRFIKERSSNPNVQNPNVQNPVTQCYSTAFIILSQLHNDAYFQLCYHSNRANLKTTYRVLLHIVLSYIVIVPGPSIRNIVWSSRSSSVYLHLQRQ